MSAIRCSKNVEDFRPTPAERAARSDERLVLVLPGSRRQEIRRLAPVFGETLGRVAAGRAPFELVLPTLPHLADEIAVATADWPVQPRIVTGEAEKHAAFRRARAALAASGTVTLELGLAHVPQVVAYRVPLIEGWIGRLLVLVHSVVLTNLILGENVVPEFLQTDCTAEKLAPALAEIIDDTPARRRQIEALDRLDGILAIDGKPSERAARAVLDLLGRTGPLTLAKPARVRYQRTFQRLGRSPPARAANEWYLLAAAADFWSSRRPLNRGASRNRSDVPTPRRHHRCPWLRAARCPHQ